MTALELWSWYTFVTFVRMMRSPSRAWTSRVALCVLMAVTVGSVAMGRTLRLLRNVGFQAGPVWWSGRAIPGLGWEVSFDRYLRTCIRHRPFLGLGIGRQDGFEDGAAVWSLRFSLSPYYVQIDRRWRFMTLTSIRLNHWSTPLGGTDCIRPEVGFQFMQLNHLFSPKLAIGYGREWRLGGAVERPVAPVASEALTVQVGLSLNLGALRSRKFYKRRAHSAAAPGQPGD